MTWPILFGLIVLYAGMYLKVNADYHKIQGDKEWIDHNWGVIWAWPFNLVSGMLLYLSAARQWRLYLYQVDQWWLKILVALISIVAALCLARSIWWLFFDWWLNALRGHDITYTGTDDKKNDALSDRFLALLPPGARVPFKIGVIVFFTVMLYWVCL